MKIKIKDIEYAKALEIKPAPHKKPTKQWLLFRWLLNVLSVIDLIKVNFKYNKINMEKLDNKTPCLVLMNHSSFIDLKIASRLLAKRPYNIICTSDGFVGKEWLMRKLGCIPTTKFQTDATLIRDMSHILKNLKSSILMYPEASYSFDGTALALPASLGKCIKLLNVPVVFIKTYGAFSRDPLYNGLRLRKVSVSADMEYLLTPEDIKTKTADEINEILKEKFNFDAFKWQQENKIKISEPFIAEGLNRVLYKCPNCHKEETLKCNGNKIYCTECNKEYILDEYGYIKALNGETEFSHIPDWYNWQREEVRKEIEEGKYKISANVKIGLLIDYKAIYRVGEGKLVHDVNGFHLKGANGELEIIQKPNAYYSLYSDYFWYEISDIVCIGSGKMLYYCFLEEGTSIATKARLATEELYKINALLKK